ncbi:MAG: elongation factor Ts [Candidatus Pacebacteria bacterium]|nr:elongation factor Ts [Candidatus Paceibacterota bacterium]
MENNIEKIKKLREETNMSVMECRNALLESGEDFEKAREILKAKGLEENLKRKERETKEGVIETYVHQNKKIGALVKLSCESDFVAKNEEFQRLAHEIAMQISAMDPASVDDLLEQTYIRDPKIKIVDLINEAINKFGENIKIEEFQRMKI